MTHTQEEADAELREKLKQLKFDHTDSTPDGYNSLCDEDIDEIMAAVQAHNARIGENRYDTNRLGTYVFVGDSDRIKNLDDLYWSYVMEHVARESASYDHYRLEYVKQNMRSASFDKVGIHKLLACADQYAKERLTQLSPIQPEKGASDEMRKVW